MKTCTGCGETKPLDGGFHRDKRSRDGRVTRCKSCVKAYQAEWLERPEVRAHKAEYRARADVKARVAEYNAEYRRQNRDAILAQQAEHRAHPDVKARKAEYNAEYHADNPRWVDGYLRRARKYGFEPVVESFTKDELIARWGDACVHCGGPFEELDHYPIPVAKGGHHVIENCRPSCTPCNAKGCGIRRTNTNETENTK